MSAKNPLTLISPMWATILSDPTTDPYNVTRDKLDIAHPAFCIVGEAHGFTQDYARRSGCSACKDYSMRFVRGVKADPEIRERLISSFVDTSSLLTKRKSQMPRISSAGPDTNTQEVRLLTDDIKLLSDDELRERLAKLRGIDLRSVRATGRGKGLEDATNLSDEDVG